MRFNFIPVTALLFLSVFNDQTILVRKLFDFYLSARNNFLALLLLILVFLFSTSFSPFSFYSKSNERVELLYRISNGVQRRHNAEKSRGREKARTNDEHLLTTKRMVDCWKKKMVSQFELRMTGTRKRWTKNCIVLLTYCLSHDHFPALSTSASIFPPFYPSYFLRLLLSFFSSANFSLHFSFHSLNFCPIYTFHGENATYELLSK